MHYRQIWENHHNRSIPKGCEIHHIDGNRQNNQPENLLCVTIEEHLDIHKKQKDWGAVQAILMRMDHDRDQIRQAASKHQLKLIKEGRHNWQKMTSEERSRLSKEIIRKRIEDGNGAFLNVGCPIENGRYGGRIAAEKQAGFLDTKSKNHGSKHVKDTKWWVNEKGERVRAVSCPGDNWQRGMKYAC